MQTKRFVVLLHEKPGDVHWDLMLETDGGLATWAIEPQSEPLASFRCEAERLPDHRRLYLDYEGPVSNGRGSVSRVDAGTFEALGRDRFRLRGALFRGILAVEAGMKNKIVTLIFEDTDNFPNHPDD